MSLDTYAALKASVVSWLDVPTVTFTTQIDDIVTIAETRILREARTKDNEQALSTSIGSGVFTLPSAYLEMKSLRLNSSPVQSLERRSAEWIYSEYPSRSSSGIPRFFAREGGDIIFGPYPDSGYSISGVYYKRLGPLSTTLHALFTNNPDLYLFACLSEAELLIGRDERIKIWEAKYQAILTSVNGLDNREDSSGSVLRIR